MVAVEEQMGDVTLIPVGNLRRGDKLGQDIMVGSQVLLRSGTELNDGQIQRIQRLPIQRVAIFPVSTPVLHEESPAREQARLPDFRDLGSSYSASWMSDEYFSQIVTMPVQLTPTEQQFSKNKHELRKKAGLKPMVDPEREAHIRKEIQAAFISSALKKELNLDQLGAAAQSLVNAMQDNPTGFFSYEDITQYGQFLAATALTAGKVFHSTRADKSHTEMTEHIRGQFAMVNAYAMLPFGVDHICDKQANVVQREKFREALMRYYSWMRRQRFVSERTLELVLLQHERYDGQGSPYGLHGAMLPPESEAWSLATAYSSRLYSQPKQPRLTGREAADHMISQSGRAFSARGVNRLLTTVGYYATGSLVELSDERLALVVEQSERALLKPLVRVLDADGAASEALDLHQMPELYIRRQVLEY